MPYATLLYTMLLFPPFLYRVALSQVVHFFAGSTIILTLTILKRIVFLRFSLFLIFDNYILGKTQGIDPGQT